MAAPVAGIAMVVLLILGVRYVAFEYAHGVRPIVQHLLEFAS